MTANLTWSAVGATSYDISFGTANPPPQVATGLTTASYSPASLNGNTRYYWRVSARNAGGASIGPIGLVLTLIHLVGIPVDNLSVNPARSIGPAVFVGSSALRQLWLFIVAPLAGAVVGAAVHLALHGGVERIDPVESAVSGRSSAAPSMRARRDLTSPGQSAQGP